MEDLPVTNLEEDSESDRDRVALSQVSDLEQFIPELEELVEAQLTLSPTTFIDRYGGVRERFRNRRVSASGGINLNVTDDSGYEPGGYTTNTEDEGLPTSVDTTLQTEYISCSAPNTQRSTTSEYRPDVIELGDSPLPSPQPSSRPFIGNLQWERLYAIAEDELKQKYHVDITSFLRRTVRSTRDVDHDPPVIDITGDACFSSQQPEAETRLPARPRNNNDLFPRSEFQYLLPDISSTSLHNHEPGCHFPRMRKRPREQGSTMTKRARQQQVRSTSVQTTQSLLTDSVVNSGIAILQPTRSNCTCLCICDEMDQGYSGPTPANRLCISVFHNPPPRQLPPPGNVFDASNELHP